MAHWLICFVPAEDDADLDRAHLHMTVPVHLSDTWAVGDVYELGQRVYA